MDSKSKKTRAKQHAFIENVSIFGAEARMGPIALHFYAEKFLSVARLAPSENFAPVKAFLVCRAIELGFKAFLSIKKFRLSELAGGQFGHDLENLLRDAQKQGLNDLIQLDEKQIFQILRASTYYKEKVFEYPAVMEMLTAYSGMPNVEELVAIAELLVSKLDEPCMQAS